MAGRFLPEAPASSSPSPRVTFQSLPGLDEAGCQSSGSAPPGSLPLSVRYRRGEIWKGLPVSRCAFIPREERTPVYPGTVA